MAPTYELRICLSCKILGCMLTRGLCRKCYQTALQQVRAGMYTWEQAIAEGKALPRAKPRCVLPQSGNYYRTRYT